MLLAVLTLLSLLCTFSCQRSSLSIELDGGQHQQNPLLTNLIIAAVNDERHASDATSLKSASRVWTLAVESKAHNFAIPMLAIVQARIGAASGDGSVGAKALDAASIAFPNCWVTASWAAGAFEFLARRLLAHDDALNAKKKRIDTALVSESDDSFLLQPVLRASGSARAALERSANLYKQALEGREAWLQLHDCKDGRVSSSGGDDTDDDAEIDLIVAACLQASPNAAMAYPPARHARTPTLLGRGLVTSLLWLGREKEARTLLVQWANAIGWIGTAWARPIQVYSRIDVPDGGGEPLSPFSDGQRAKSRGGSKCYETELRALEYALFGVAAEVAKLTSWEREGAGLSAEKPWSTILLTRNGLAVNETICTIVPRTCALVMDTTPLIHVRGGQAKISLLVPGARIRPHAGPAGDRVRAHCTIFELRAGAHAATLRVGSAKARNWHTGECFIFDEQFEHEVKIDDNNNVDDEKDARIVILVDLANPFLTHRNDFQNAVTSESWDKNASLFDAIRLQAHASQCWKDGSDIV